MKVLFLSGSRALQEFAGGALGGLIFGGVFGGVEAISQIVADNKSYKTAINNIDTQIQNNLNKINDYKQEISNIKTNKEYTGAEKIKISYEYTKQINAIEDYNSDLNKAKTELSQIKSNPVIRSVYSVEPFDSYTQMQPTHIDTAIFDGKDKDIQNAFVKVEPLDNGTYKVVEPSGMFEIKKAKQINTRYNTIENVPIAKSTLDMIYNSERQKIANRAAKALKAETPGQEMSLSNVIAEEQAPVSPQAKATIIQSPTADENSIVKKP